MPFPFTLPTTSAFSFSSSFSSESHPSLPLTASTHRGVLRDGLKKHKRLPPLSQANNLAAIQQNLYSYLPYLLAIDGGLSNNSVSGEEIDCILTSTPKLEWRPTISSTIPGREAPRIKLESLEYEIYFVLSTLAYSYTNLSRSALHPLYASDSASPSPEARTLAITTATKHLLLAASVHNYLGTRSESVLEPAACIDLSTSTFRALSSLAHAEATLLAVLKDDPYPAAVAQDRNANDKEWMIKAPEIPKVRAHLFARLCLAAADHASKALSLLNASAGKSKAGKVDEALLKYVEDFKRTGRGKACRFFAIDAELGGQTGAGIAWCRAGMQELGFVSLLAEKEAGKKSTFSKLKKDWSEKKEDRKVEKGTAWGSDAGRLEESRVLTMLEAKWVKMNDTINTQVVPPSGPLLATMPTGRDIHNIKAFELPSLESSVLEAMRAPPEQNDDFGEEGDSSDEDAGMERAPAGAFPGTSADYSGKGSYY